MRIMVVEDDKTIASGLEFSLQQDGCETIVCHQAGLAEMTIREKINQIDLFLFDLSLPDGSGYDLCQKVKQLSDKPVIFLTALDDEVNVVMGLDMGADDYITKPFRIRELLSRIKSVARRYQKSPNERSVITCQNIKINKSEGKVFKSGEEVLLTALEYRLLLIFANHIGQILTRDQLLERIWDIAGEFVNDNTLTVYIKRLREKLEEQPQKPTIITTVRGMGYRMEELRVTK
ncbi:DNA-binding response regulator, OmpR family, contains REC and winged-helix (wHTH) domain [Gracilibacillus ureilyticus]|uniref:DNA-binding response regulator, OmpR family, contains REC and winged-helix (WHTH) domain n=1 Tax=Gracilibacillus ureilyticus TaxID=531814 RepID=A0A1H9UU71_9BACI|nr:response regulator transcription factor [Gracilibacillus ureilyticus]SES12908.1 DNA-binding response regulator, OmpR family, contains REC and winged-helix (wHTH) domain [Gracilibacillus ureilyticus]